LPSKPSELLILAMEDLEKIESMNHISIDMSKWFSENIFNGRCSVCHAGAIMYNLVKEKNIEFPHVNYLERNGRIGYLEPSDFGIDTENKLVAINAIRCGNIDEFFSNLKVKNPWVDENGSYLHDCGLDDNGATPSYYSVHGYMDSDNNEYNWQVYKNWIVSFIGILQAEGL
jgi:hypothetical protein